MHLVVKLKNRSWVLTLSISSNHGVPCEDIRASDLGKYLVGIGHGGFERYSGENEVFANVWVAEWNTMPYREGMDLLQLQLGGCTALQESNALLENMWYWVLWGSW